MLMDIINEYRTKNGKEPMWNWDGLVSDYCTGHSIAMANRNEIYHAEPCFLNGWGEAVAMSYCLPTWNDTMRHLIFKVFGESQEHKNIILNSETLAYGFITSNNKIFITIRGK